jgi:beta-glucosidase
MPLIDQAVGRILAAKARLGLFDEPYRFGDAAVEAKPRDRAAARQLARRSIVLLRNEGGLLPLKPGAKVALVGALAGDASSALGSWRARGRADEVVTLQAALGGEPAATDVAAAVAAAKRAEVVLLAIGEDYDMTGEARSRADLGLPGTQQQLIDALKAAGAPIVAILMNGRPLALEKALDGIPAVIESWFLGIESGNALKDVIFGAENPAGRLPMGMPRVTGQAPMSYAHRPTGRPADPDLKVDSARYHDVAIGPLFPFGHGLSYTRFDYSALSIEGTARIGVTVTNAGPVAGEEVVQLYVRDPVASVERPVRELRGFARIALAPGHSRRVTFTLTPEQFAFWQDGGWVIEPGRIEVMVGASSDDIRATGAFEIRARGTGTAPAAAIETRVEIA